MPFRQGTYHQLLVMLLGFTSVTAVNSDSIKTNSIVHTAPAFTYFGTLSAGVAWENGGEMQTLYLQPDIIKTYTSTKNTNTLAGGELFLGIQKSLPQDSVGQLGLEVAAFSDATLSGEIWDDGNPNLNNFNYHYTLSHSHIAVKGKLLKNMRVFSPYVFGSVGVGYNKTNSFTIVPNNSESVPAPSFLDHSETSVAYTLGTGLEKTINEHLRFGIGYEFANWGKSTFAAAPGQTLGQGPQLNHLYTHQLQCSISYTI